MRAAHDVLFIADEVMTGWGRTGTLFACEQAGDHTRHPLPRQGADRRLAAAGRHALHARNLRGAPLARPDENLLSLVELYTANPIACAAALANLEIWETEPVAERIADLARRHAERIGALASQPHVARVRHLGTIAAFDLEVGDGGYLSAVGPQAASFLP